MAKRAPAGTPTDLNVSVLGRYAMGRREFPNAVEAVSAPHIRRCLRAGLIEIVSRTTLRLTDAGVAAVNAASRPVGFYVPGFPAVSS